MVQISSCKTWVYQTYHQLFAFAFSSDPYAPCCRNEEFVSLGSKAGSDVLWVFAPGAFIFPAWQEHQSEHQQFLKNLVAKIWTEAAVGAHSRYEHQFQGSLAVRWAYEAWFQKDRPQQERLKPKSKDTGWHSFDGDRSTPAFQVEHAIGCCFEKCWCWRPWGYLLSFLDSLSLTGTQLGASFHDDSCAVCTGLLLSSMIKLCAGVVV